jgi:hypothetical protein
MIVNIPAKEGDNDSFLAALNGLVATLVKEYSPEHVYVIRIKKWFDHKWLRYSGKGRVEFKDGLPLTDTALDVFWQEKLTFPPFNPKQIGMQLYWKRLEDGTYGGTDHPRRIHKRRFQSSSWNLHNRVSAFCTSGIFVWFSSNTENNTHGCIMVYVFSEKGDLTWYASLKAETNWKIDRIKGIKKEVVQSWFPLG